MGHLITAVIEDCLKAFYEPFWFALLISILFMFVFKKYHSVRAAANEWITWFKTEKDFRKIFIFTFYTAMILFRTLLNRSSWLNPLSDVMGFWKLFEMQDGQLVYVPGVAENMIMFFPFDILMFWAFHDKLLGKDCRFAAIVLSSVRITFLCSLTIEMSQLVLRLGTWQFSDLCYNTMGGLAGGITYWLFYKILQTLRKT